jgi:RNA-binding protein PNO1
MVVVHAQPSSSSPAQKKNRRKLNKKRMAGGEDTDMHDTVSSNSAGGTHDAAENDEDLVIDTEDPGMSGDMSAPAFGPLPASAQWTMLKSETRRIPIPPHRMTPLKKEWVNIFGPLTEILGLQVRMNVQRRSVEIRVCISLLVVRECCGN